MRIWDGEQAPHFGYTLTRKGRRSVFCRRCKPLMIVAAICSIYLVIGFVLGLLAD